MSGNSVNTRDLVLEMLMEINEKGQKSHLILSDVLGKYQFLSKQERAFITRVTEGTLEHLIELDYIINLFSKTKVKKMKPFIRNLIRMSVYQIKYMDSVPDSAACNEAVKLARKHGFSQLSGFVNGVVRNISRNLDNISLPKEKIKYLSVKYSMPEWIVEHFIDEYDEQKAEEILDGFFKETKLSIRTNTNKCTAKELKERLISEGVTVEDVENLPYAFRISDFDYLNALSSFNDGWFYVQDVSSMMVAEYADVKKDDIIIDVCAAPGGKSTHLAEKLNGSGMVYSRDLTEYKVNLIKDNIERHELKNMQASCMDATVFDENSVEKADILICDLPCSGLGVLGKKTDIRYKITKPMLQELCDLQKDILETVHTYVKRNGQLIYSTCTIDSLENEKNVQWFLDNHKDFSLVKQQQMFPGEVGQDGFFIAKFVRN